MDLIYLRLDELTEYKNNARVHTPEDINAIEESIKAFGFNDPVGVWGSRNIVVEGHGRLAAARNLGMETVPCIRLDWMTDEERRAYALAHNRTAELSGWDYETVEEELRSIQDYDMSVFGFEGYELTEDELNDILEDPPQRDKEPKQIQCPVCGEWFEI